MGLVLRRQWESYMDCSGIDECIGYELIGEGFTVLSESKNPKLYTRKYSEDETEQTDVIGYAPSISYTCDAIEGEPVVAKIIAVTDNEMVGEKAKVDIVSVNLWQNLWDDVYYAYKRTYTIVPGVKGSGTGAMTYTGTLNSSGDVVKGVFVRSAKTFEPYEYTEFGG